MCGVHIPISHPYSNPLVSSERNPQIYPLDILLQGVVTVFVETISDPSNMCMCSLFKIEPLFAVLFEHLVVVHLCCCATFMVGRHLGMLMTRSSGHCPNPREHWTEHRAMT